MSGIDYYLVEDFGIGAFIKGTILEEVMVCVCGGGGQLFYMGGGAMCYCLTIEEDDALEKSQQLDVLFSKHPLTVATSVFILFV